MAVILKGVEMLMPMIIKIIPIALNKNLKDEVYNEKLAIRFDIKKEE
jgi:hypothetical protein